MVIGMQLLGLTTRNLKDTVTWWAVSLDGSGGFTYANPVILLAKWEEHILLNEKGSGGQDITSKTTVFLSQDVSIGDYLALGDQSLTVDPTTLKGAFRIQEYRSYTDIRGVEMVRQASL